MNKNDIDSVENLFPIILLFYKGIISRNFAENECKKSLPSVNRKLFHVMTQISQTNNTTIYELQYILCTSYTCIA